MSAPPNQRDRLTALALFAVALALRVPFRSQYAYHWDGAQFALAIQHFDLRLGQPHAPGYYLYVLLGRLVNVFVGDPHASLVWISVVAGAALPALGFLLASALYGRAAGVATAVILATSPLCWFHSEIALTTIVDGALVTALMLVGWRAIQRGGRWRDVVAMAVLLAWIAGNRPQTAVGLLPVWVFVFSKFERRVVKLMAGIGLATLFCLAWLAPLAQTAGGWREFSQLLRWKLDFDAQKTLWGGGLPAARESLNVIVRSCWTGLLLAAGIAGVAWRWRVRGTKLAAVMLTWWIVPLIGCGVLSYTTMPGYALSYFPALAIVAGRACTRWFFIAAIAITNTVVFLGNVPAGLTAREILRHDGQLADACAAIRGRYRPEEVLLCHRQEFFVWGLRHFQYHLPEFSNTLLGRDVSLPAERAGKYRICRGAQTEFVDDWMQAAGGRKLLLVVPPGEVVALFDDKVDATHAVPVADGLFELQP